MIRTAIVGGTGYGGMELLRLALDHPELDVTTITSRTERGPVTELHPHLQGFTDLEFNNVAPVELAQDHELVFFAAPHGVAAEHAPMVLDANAGTSVIDLSGDFRLADGPSYAAAYGAEHPHPEWLGKVAYGLPECGQREALVGARLVANPGCHATAAVLALWPLVRAGLVAGRASVASVTGSSGSGSRPGAGTHHPERCVNFKAYKPLAHQHAPEIERALDGCPVDFVPHSAPFSRGIHVTAFVPLPKGREDEVLPAYLAAYENEPFLRMRSSPPELRAVVGTNCVDLHVTVSKGTAVVLCALDNLVKGMAGSAVQNANRLFGLDETAGLLRPGLGL